MEIRLLGPEDDRLAVSHVYEESWKYAYRGMIPNAYLDGIPRGRWASGLDAPGRASLVALDGGRIVGTCSYNASRFEKREGWGEIISLYLLPEAMGRGIGRMLLEAAVAALHRRGFQDVFLWVLEENVRARKVYERAGFHPSGATMDIEIGGRSVREMEYILCEDGQSDGRATSRGV